MYQSEVIKIFVQQFPQANLIISDHRSYRLIKRLLDVIISSVALFFLLPLFGVIAILIKVDSPGPVIFKQKRIGKDGKLFSFLKFRSMVVNAEQIREKIEHLNILHGPLFKVKGDPRITRIGAFLRKFSLDELPQLLNVIKGEMSLVGPRPLPAEDLKLIPTIDTLMTIDMRSYGLWKELRTIVKPGVSGLWQVNGRSELPLEGWVEFDLYYIRNRSIWLDFFILLRTVPAVLSGRGAE